MIQPLLPFAEGTRAAKFLRREKRFSVLVRLDVPEPSQTWVHTNNTGSMLGLLHPGCRVLISPAGNPKRKLAWTLEAAHRMVNGRGEHDSYASVNTLAPNRMLKAAWGAGLIPELANAAGCKPEATAGESRLDARFDGPDGCTWVEAKNVTLCPDGAAAFPDAISQRAHKHLETLMRLAAQGAQTAVFYLVSMADAECFGPAGDIDPEYARLFYTALERGVQAWPYLCGISTAGLTLGRRLPVRAP